MKFFVEQTPDGHFILRMKVGEVVSFVPTSEDNRHYQEYQAWLEAGNTPEPWQPEITVADIPVEDVIEDGD